MAGPGGVEVGRISVRVVPDTSKFAANLRADLKRLETSLRLDIPVELDTSGIAEHARAATEEANAAAGKVKIKTEVDQRALATTTRDLTRFSVGLGSSISSILKGATFAGLGLSALGSVPGILALSGSLASLAGVVALMPALFNGAAVGVTALVIGVHGFGQAIKDVGNTDKFNADLKKLAPSARTAALAIKGLVPQFTALRKSVQQALFAHVGAEIQVLARNLLPPLKAGLTGVATAFNYLGLRAAGAFVQMAQSGQITATLTPLRQALLNLGPAIQPLIKAFGQLTVVGTSFLPGFATAIARASQQFGSFIAKAAQTGQIAAFIQGGVDAFKQLGQVALGATRLIAGIVSAAQKAGGGTLAAFAGLLQHVADVVNSPAFQTGLVAVFAGLQDGAQSLASALPAVGAALAALGPAVASLARGLGSTLAAALKALGPVVIALAPPLTDLLNALGPKLVAGINAAAPVLARFAQQLAANKPLLVVVAIAIAALIDPIAGVVLALAILVANFDKVRTFLAPLGPLFASIGTAIQPVIVAFQQLGAAIVARFQAVIPIFQLWLSVVQQNLPQIQAIVTQVFSTIASIVIAVMTVIRVQIQAGTAVIQFIWAHFGDIITSVVRKAFPAALTVIRGVLNVIQGIFRLFTALLTGDWSGAWHAIEQIVRGAGQVISGIVRELFATLQGLARIGIRAFVGFFTGLGSKVLAAVGNIGGMFTSVGADIIHGIENGVKGAAGALASAVTGAASGALNAVKSHLHINSPSKLFAREVGSPISEGIAYGITGSAGMVSSAVIGAVSPPNLSSLGGVAGAGRGGSPLVNVEQMVTHDPDEAARALTGKFTEALTVANLQGALVGV